MTGGIRFAIPPYALARSERFELPTLGFEVRCSIQLSYERFSRATLARQHPKASPGNAVSGVLLGLFRRAGLRKLHARVRARTSRVSCCDGEATGTNPRDMRYSQSWW